MKLASLDDGSTAGLPVVVSRDLSRCAPATAIVGNVTQALLDWERFAERLRALATRVEAGRGEAWRFHEAQALAPVARVASIDGTEVPLGAARAPLVQAGSTAPGHADVCLVALSDGEGRARLLVPVLRLADGPTGQGPRWAAAAVAITPDELDEVLEPRHQPRLTFECVRHDDRLMREWPLVAAPSYPRAPSGGTVPFVTFAEEGVCRLPARTGDRLRASLRDAKGRPIAGVIDTTIDPPAPRMAAIGRSRPPMQQRS